MPSLSVAPNAITPSAPRWGTSMPPGLTHTGACTGCPVAASRAARRAGARPERCPRSWRAPWPNLQPRTGSLTPWSRDTSRRLRGRFRATLPELRNFRGFSQADKTARMSLQTGRDQRKMLGYRGFRRFSAAALPPPVNRFVPGSSPGRGASRRRSQRAAARFVTFAPRKCCVFPPRKGSTCSFSPARRAGVKTAAQPPWCLYFCRDDGAASCCPDVARV
jgi:hypothetical protein